MDFFLAYYHEDNQLAGRIKAELERRGSTAFLAHEDIEISKTWREEILSHLKDCQALIAVVTPKFQQSAYANQEAGIILGRGKPVISLNFTKELPGFLESIQAIHISESNIGAAVDKAIKVIEGREPDTYIELAFKTTQEVEEIAIAELARHIHRSEGTDVEIDTSNITRIVLDEEKGIFELGGRARSIIHYVTTFWIWKMNVDARSGRILSKTIGNS